MPEMLKLKRILKNLNLFSKVVKAEISVLAPSELLTGRVALVTGGTSGIGYEIARAFINAGADVIITGRNVDKIDKACVSIEQSVANKGKIWGVVMDVRDIQKIEDSFTKVFSKIPGKQLDILVNNAGLHGGSLRTATEEEFDNIMDTNLKGAFFLTRLFSDYMIKNEIRGNILNVVSASGIRPATSVYHISKWGLRGFTEGTARLLAPHGIVVNAIAPGPTATPMLKKDGRIDDIHHERNLLGRYALPEEIANMSVILVSNMSRTIIGDTIYMSGGGGNLTNEDTVYNY